MKLSVRHLTDNNIDVHEVKEQSSLIRDNQSTSFKKQHAKETLSY